MIKGVRCIYKINDRNRYHIDRVAILFEKQLKCYLLKLFAKICIKQIKKFRGRKFINTTKIRNYKIIYKIVISGVNVC